MFRCFLPLIHLSAVIVVRGEKGRRSGSKFHLPPPHPSLPLSLSLPIPLFFLLSPFFHIFLFHFSSLFCPVLFLFPSSLPPYHLFSSLFQLLFFPRLVGHLPFSFSAPFSYFMPFPLLARKVKKFASQHLLQLKHFLGGRSFLKFKRLYRLKGALGHGGFGIVYRAVRISDQLPVAVKFIERRNVREWGKLDDHKVPMEIALLARCSNVSGVIALIDWFSLPEGFLIVMERPIPCVDLFDFIHHQKVLDENLARFLFRPIVKTVIDLAERKMLHRDLKDENILVNLANGQIKLIDFGAATMFTRNRCHDFQGTRLYCPPEWFLHSLYLGREATVWSLGILLFNMLNGRLPFLNEKDICTAHLLGPLPFFATLSKAARDLLAQCLCFDASSRPTLYQILAHPWLNDASAPISWCQLSACCSQLIVGKVEETDGQRSLSGIGQRDKMRRKNGGGRKGELGLALSCDEQRLGERLCSGKENCASFSRQRRCCHSSAQHCISRHLHTTALSPSINSNAASINALRPTQHTANFDHFSMIEFEDLYKQ